MSEPKCKVFKDPIYGYISLREDLCSDFIDTPIFQRLRRIEQTSMRILFPSAHHDRFAHSIGTYHLGQIAFSHLKKNSAHFFPEITADEWNSYRNTFEIACLMHDCAHAPFSHTFEHYYTHGKEENIRNRLSLHFNQASFLKEYNSASPAPHEKASALLLLDFFCEKLKKHDANPLLAARMIMGCKHNNPDTLHKKFENRLISLLNGAGIDVDSLDYIQRDSWFSGVSNVDIDYERLLSALMIKADKQGNFKIVFKKSALSVLENISIGRNFLYKWIYSHHIVTYEQYLLNNIIERINSISDNKLSNSIFSLDAFSHHVTFNNASFFLPSDDDIMHIIKQQYEENENVKEFLSRQYRYKALWKTYFEFNEVHFADVSNDNRMLIQANIKEGELTKKYGENTFLCLEAKPKLKSINKNDFFIDIDGELIDAAKAVSLPTENLNYFILYCIPDLVPRKEEILHDILSTQT